MKFIQLGAHNSFNRRRLLCQNLEKSLQKSVHKANQKYNKSTDWEISLEENVLFDFPGLLLIAEAVINYSGGAKRLNFKLKLSAEAIRDYYSHSQFLNSDSLTNELVDLPIEATSLININNQSSDTVVITINELRTDISYPLSLIEPDTNSTPLALLMPYNCSHDFLFANQIAIFSNLNKQIRRSPLSWIRALINRRSISLNRRISLSWKSIHKSADIHPTAVIEGSIIGPGCKVGAHCVVRYSVLGENVQLHDGAKAEYSVVDDNSWLMHDLVLYRCLVESDVFLIHGPYQFSYFQKKSSAFASIMMDYRPDGKSIIISCKDGKREYRGRFLGALLKENSKVLGGTLTVPGITIPEGKFITSKLENITRSKDL